MIVTLIKLLFKVLVHFKYTQLVMLCEFTSGLVRYSLSDIKGNILASHTIVYEL